MEINNEELLSPQEREVKKILADATQQINDLDYLIENLPPDKAQPKLELVPKGGKSPLGRTRSEMEAALREQQETIKETTRVTVEGIADTMRGEPRDKIRMDLDIWENPEFYKLTPEDRKSIAKPLTHSQHLNIELLELSRLDRQNKFEEENRINENIEQQSDYNILIKSLSFLYIPDKKIDKEIEKELDLDKE